MGQESSIWEERVTLPERASEEGRSAVSACFDAFVKLKKRMEDSGSISGKFIFRGVKSVGYEVISSAGRRMRERYTSNKQSDFIRYHVKLVANARKFGYGNVQFEKELSDLEVLARIQHFGGATCLTDFTTNFLIALWFATAPYKDKAGKDEFIDKGSGINKGDGQLVCLDLADPDNFRLIHYCIPEQEKEPIQKLLKGLDFSQFTKNQNKALPCFWLWEPTKLNSRIIKQESIFLFGLRKFPKAGEYQEDSLRSGRLVIPEKTKDLIRRELEDFFGISAETVFYDLQGYALNANDAELPISRNLLSTKDCLSVAKESIKKGELSLAVNYLDQSIECYRKRKNEGSSDTGEICIKECNRKRGNNVSPCIEEQRGEVLFWRARAIEQRGEAYREEAILNYYDAIKEFGENVDRMEEINESYRRLIYLYYESKDYESAFKVAEKVWKLYEANRGDSTVSIVNDGHDVVFSLLELCILSGKKEEFFLYKKETDKLKGRFENTNGYFLWSLFGSIGKMIFEERKSEKEVEGYNREIQNKLGYILKTSERRSVNLIGYYYWDFSDLFKWSDSKADGKDRGDLNLLIQRAYEAQSKLVYHVFANSDAFEKSE